MSNLKLIKFQVTNFRNLNPDITEFSPGINCIFGENGNGKTNLLEAIYVLINRKSFRKNASFPQFLSMDGEKCEIYFSSLFYEENTESKITYSGILNNSHSEWHLERRAVKEKIKSFIIFINPFDFYSFHYTPKFRREWFDHHISGLNKVYKKNLNHFQHALRIRNKLLGQKPRNYLLQIKAIDELIAGYSFSITQDRLRFLNEISQSFTQVFKKIFSEENNLTIALTTKFTQLSHKDIFNFYQNSLSKDEEAGLTLYGVHRDDYMLLMNGLSSIDFSSLGQQKMSYLSLLFAYVELFRYKFNSYPIVLIDDISGELDHSRWQKLIEYLEKGSFQVFITTANDSFKEKLEKIKQAKKIYINEGKITAKS